MVDNGMGPNNQGTMSSVPDFYLACGYIPLTKKNYQGVMGNDVLTCPLAVQKLGVIFRIYTGGASHCEHHFFFSSLISQNAPWTSSTWNFREVRTNHWGPYKPEEIAKPADTLFSGDAVATVGHPSYYNDSAGTIKAEYSMDRNFRWDFIGVYYLAFGSISLGWRTDWPGNQTYYHEFGANGAYWDGHVETVTPPAGETDKFAFRNQVTRDGTGN
jgi:prepilin-type processing-associated H-X9-DG protein